jgi:hypothetical protein
VDSPLFSLRQALGTNDEPLRLSGVYVPLLRQPERAWVRYLNVSPSEKALKKEREKLHEMTNHRQCFQPIPQLIEKLNRRLKGWGNYFDLGYPRQAFREINA